MGATKDLLLLTFIMFILTLACGLIPLKCNVGNYYNNIIATLAAGLLLGTACIVILPEGIEMLIHGLGHHDDHDDEHIEEESEEDEHGEQHSEEGFNGALAGFAILSGIIFMILVNRFGPRHSDAHGCGKSCSNGAVGTSSSTVVKNHLFMARSYVPPGEKTGETGAARHLVELTEVKESQGRERTKDVITPPPENKQKVAAVTLGLLIHAMFDGVALGIVTSGGDDAKLNIVVFGALMGHKAPEAISLTLILLAQEFAPCGIIINLLLFAAAAPVGALIIFLILEFGTESAENAGDILGYCMLFAGGTFIGVIFEHILPELKRSETGKFAYFQILIFAIGALIPLSLPADHGH